MQRRAVEQARRTSEQARAEACAGFEVLDEIDGFLKRHSVFEPYTPSDFEREQRALDRLAFEGLARSSLPIQDCPLATERV
jgi:hypothetical protein